MKLTLFGYELILKKKKRYKYLMKIPNKNFKPWLGNYQDNRPYRYLRTRTSVKNYIMKGGKPWPKEADQKKTN